jgi:hypothetical protein
MTLALQLVYVALMWLFTLAVLAQAYFAGMIVFGVPGGQASHASVGWIMALGTILLPPLALLGRFPRGVVIHTLVLFALMLLQVMLVTYFQNFQQPLLTALHPVNAFLLFGASTMAAVRATAYLRRRRSGNYSQMPARAAA